MKKTQDYNSQRLFFILDVVLLMAIVVAALFLPMAFDKANENQALKTPHGSFSWVDVVSPSTISVHIADVSPSTNFYDCSVKVTTPDTAVTVLLQPNTLQYSVNAGTLTNVRTSSSTVIQPDDNITLIGSGALKTGLWRVALIDKEGGGVIAERIVVVPSANKPHGGFTSAYLLDASHAHAVLGITTPATDFSYCSVKVSSPDGESFLWKIDRYNPSIYKANDTLVFSMTDVSSDHIISSGDSVDISSSVGTLALGTWTVSLIYDYGTQEQINQIMFDVQ
jgi:hypothetical protein